MEVEVRGYAESSQNAEYHTLFEILGISLKISSISNWMCKKPNISKILI